MKLYLAQINPTVGDIAGNVQKILAQYKIAQEQGCDLAVFGEMAITGYPAQDLWQKKYFVQAANDAVLQILEQSRNSHCAILFGCPALTQNRAKKDVISNAAYFIEQGEIKKIIRKKTLPNYGVFDEKRYFEPENSLSFIEFRDQTLAILICEDIWDLKNIYLLKEQIFDNVIVINASPYSAHKHIYRTQMAKNFSATINKPLIYLNLVGGQDSIVLDGTSFVVNEKGEKVLQMKSFEEDAAIIEMEKGFVGACVHPHEESENMQTPPLQENPEISARNYSACVLGLRDYVTKTGFSKVMLGMSGGVDSALVAVMAVDAFGPENVSLYALPTKYNSPESFTDAQTCANKISCNLQVISIESIFETMQYSLETTLSNCAQNQAAIALAKENIQSRIRGNVLMSLSNASGALVLSTGNKSELAVGYATIYGDMCGAFNPLKDAYKTQVYELVKWRNDNIPAISLYKKIDLIPQNIITKAPSAELRPNQKDSDSLPDYDILDKILFALIDEKKSPQDIILQGFDENLVKKVAKLLHNSEYKRHQAVIGPKISDMSFDKDRRYPIANKFI